MRYIRLALFLIGISVLSITSDIRAQVETTSASKDPTAVTTFQTAINSMGGTSTFTAIQDATSLVAVSGSTTALPASSIKWRSIGMSLRTDTANSGGTAITAVQNWIGLQEDTSGAVTAMDSRVALTVYPFHLPGQVLVYLLSAPSESLTVINDTGADPNIVHVEAEQQLSDETLVPVTRQDWYFDTRTGLPTRVDYYLADPANPSNDGTASLAFLSWRKTPSTLVPQSAQLLKNGSFMSTLDIGPPQYNQGLTASIFQLP